MMEMVPAMMPNTYVTSNGHMLVRPRSHAWQVVDTVTDEVVSIETDLERAKTTAIKKAIAAALSS